MFTAYFLDDNDNWRPCGKSPTLGEAQLYASDMRESGVEVKVIDPNGKVIEDK